MQIVARVVVLVAVVVFCGGFVPVGGCAKGCGKLAGSGGDDVVRTGARYSDDIAISSGRYGTSYSDDIARYNTGRYGAHGTGRGAVVVPGAGMNPGDDLAHLSSSSLDDAVTALPEAEGAVASVAKKPTSSGASLDLDDAGRTFAKDYGRSVDDLKLTKQQHEEVMDAMEHVQTAVEETIGYLAEDDDDGKEARAKLQVASKDLEARLAKTLTPEQHEKFEELLGSPEVVAYRLGKEKPVKKKPAKKAKQPAE